VKTVAERLRKRIVGADLPRSSSVIPEAVRARHEAKIAKAAPSWAGRRAPALRVESLKRASESVSRSR
jgi:hypothetical protein